ncbi:MAG: PTS sugar transporter subunit IIA [Proteobacteria bacterium]|nr:PTS sugar transporter subunit IIA [Pseudomonadota bacterium]
MANILVITHGNLADEFVSIAENIAKSANKIIPVSFELTLDQSEYPAKMAEAMESVDQNEPTIILTDLFGGTPSNFAIPYIQKDKVEVITGLNIPMLIYLMTQPPGKSIEELSNGARQAGKDAIIIAGEFLQ